MAFYTIRSDGSFRITVSTKTAARIREGEPTTRKIAEAVCASMSLNIDNMFTVESDKRLAIKTVKHHLGIISNILNAAVEDELIPANPAHDISISRILEKDPKYKPAYYDEEELYDLLDALENEPINFKTLIFLAIDSGMRSGELCGLQWRDLNFKNGTASVNKQRRYVSGRGVYESRPKTEAGVRTVTLSATCVHILRDLKNYQDEILGIDLANERYIFLNPDGEKIHPNLPYRQFKRFLERHELPKITFHQLRHTNASLLISQGTDLVVLSNRLGHSDTNTTLRVYSHVIKSKEALVANRMDEFYSHGTKKAF